MATRQRRLVALQWPVPLSARERSLLWKDCRCYMTILKRIVPVTTSRSSCLQDKSKQIIPRFLISSLLYVICLSRRRNARSSGWLGTVSAAALGTIGRVRRQDSLVVFWEGGCPNEKMDGKCRCLRTISRVQRHSGDQQPHVSCQHLPAGDFCEAVVSTCRSLALFTLLRCTRTIGLTAAGALELSGLCHCCVYTYLTTALCIYASRYCDKSFLYAWLGCCSCSAGWLTGWLAVKKMQAVLVIGLTRSWSARDEQG